MAEPQRAAGGGIRIAGVSHTYRPPRGRAVLALDQYQREITSEISDLESDISRR